MRNILPPSSEMLKQFDVSITNFISTMWPNDEIYNSCVLTYLFFIGGLFGFHNNSFSILISLWEETKRDLGSIPGKGKEVFASPKHPDRLWYPAHLFNSYGRMSLAIKALVCD